VENAAVGRVINPSLELDVMAKKAAAAKAGQKKPSKPATTGRKRENVIERLAEELEARFFEGAELATRTTSAETNLALAALGAIEGPPPDVEPEVGGKAAHAKRKAARRKPR
jgi:acyl-CoA reductase-like NAD-dependent aldehyde dehydrogenase